MNAHIFVSGTRVRTRSQTPETGCIRSIYPDGRLALVVWDRGIATSFPMRELEPCDARPLSQTARTLALLDAAWEFGREIEVWLPSTDTETEQAARTWAESRDFTVTTYEANTAALDVELPRTVRIETLDHRRVATFSWSSK